MSSTKRRISEIYPETELVFINSSRPRMLDGPAPRVIRRKNGRYMLPSSPKTPTIRSQTTEDFPSVGSEGVKRKNDFISTEGEHSRLFFGLLKLEILDWELICAS